MGVDVEKFASHLRAHALPGFGQRKCALHVRQALQAAGASIPKPYPPSGKLYGPALMALGFRPIAVPDPDKFPFRKGDVMVMEPAKSGGPDGHIAGFDGRNWISDFVQRDFWAGPGYRKEKPRYAIYRP